MNFKKIFLFLAFSTLVVKAYSQDFDPSMVSQLTPEQIEMAKELVGDNESIKVFSEEPSPINESLVVNTPKADANKVPGKKYGYDFFSSTPTSLTAVGDLPLPNDYKISLRDKFSIILSGSKDAYFDLSVRLDGTILFPELGSILVVGDTFAEVKEKLSKMIEKTYIGVNIDIALENLSAKKITIVGAVKSPGTYLVNPFSTITGALGYSGGISDIGSLRDIQLIRNNGEIYSFDLYELLIKGNRSNDLTIEAGDTILIKPASKFVEIKGAVKRPAIYEILADETIDDIVNYALGFKERANKSNISVSFLDLSAGSIIKSTVKDLNQNLTDVLDVTVFSYVSEETSNILVNGAVEEPGYYDVDKYKYLDDLIKNLEFVDVYPWLAVLEQFDKNNLIKSSILFNLNDPSTYNSIELLPNSKVYFANIDSRSFNASETSKKMISDYQLVINHKQGTFRLPVYGKYSVTSFIDLLGLDMSDVDEIATYISPIEDIVINANYKDMQFAAKKYNTLSFRSPTNNLISVSISGAVEFPGTYTLSDDSTVEDLYKLAGEFKNQAYFEGISLTRQSIRERQIKAIEKAKNDLNKALLMLASNKDDGVDMSILQALSESIDAENLGRLAGNFSPKSDASMSTILFNGDSINVPKNPNSINVVGEVLNPLAFEFSKNMKIESAIEMAGGYEKFADKRRVYVITASGITFKANKNIFIKNMSLQPGDTIVVPRKIVTSNPGIDALIPVTQILSDLAFSASALDNLTNN